MRTLPNKEGVRCREWAHVAPMSTGGPLWLCTCAALAVAWVAGSSWKAEGGAMRAALRGSLGGAAAVALAFVGYGALQFLGLEVSWERVAGGAWPAIGFALLIGLVEEGAKLAGIALAAGRSSDERSLIRATASVAAVFAIAEAALALGGASWPVALGRAALGPVAHALLGVPLAVALARGGARRNVGLPARLGVALTAAALLHGLGDWSLARPGLGQAGYAAALLAPALWLFLRERVREPSPTGVRRLSVGRRGLFASAA